MICISSAWDRHEIELRNYLHRQLGNNQIAEDILQDTFVKALKNSQQFCQLENPRAWLYHVAKNSLIDFHRTHKEYEEVQEEYPQPIEPSVPVVNLSACLPQAIKQLSLEDQEIIQYCDLNGHNQADFAKQKNISLVSAKSRIQRARKKLKTALNTACKIELDEQGKVCCFDPKCQ
ncbi:MAG: sigma-70 family RNA polymerase sigma factor [Pseudomonadota bacterium]